MSRLAGLLVVALGTVAFADTPEPPASPPKTAEAAAAPSASKFPLRVVKILSDSEQALLFDANRGRYVLVEVGDTIGDYRVRAVDDDGVTLAGTEVPVEIVLGTAPEAPKPAKRAAAPQDPYADATPGVPADPYADEEPVREVSASGEPADEPVRTTTWGAPSAPTEDGAKMAVAKRGAPTDTTETDEARVLADAMAGAVAPAKAAPAATKLGHKEVTAALANFGALAAAIDASFTATGLAIERVQAGSLFAKAGLVAGDVITAVDGKPLRTLDHAADLYARAGTMKSVTVELVRGGKPRTLRLAIQ